MELWFDEEQRERVGISIPEAGYYLSLHVAFLYRFTGNERIVLGLQEWPQSDRLSLGQAVGEYLSGLTISCTAEQLLSSDVLEPEDLEQLEETLLIRDGAEAVLNLIQSTWSDLPDELMRTVPPTLAAARANLALYDQRMKARPDVVAVLGEALMAMEPHFVLPIEREREWWFHLPAQLHLRFQSTPLTTLVRGLSGLEHSARLEEVD